MDGLLVGHISDIEYFTNIQSRRILTREQLEAQIFSGEEDPKYFIILVSVAGVTGVRRAGGVTMV